MTAADVLSAAADLCERGWVRGTYAVAADGSPVQPGWAATAWCASGAILHASIDAAPYNAVLAREYDYDARALFARRLNLKLGIAEWNDDEERTQAEVVAALREAAKTAP